MVESARRGLVTCLLVVLLPFSSFAADSNAAMLYTYGAAWVNGVHVPRPTSAIFSGDLLQTRSDSVANINEAGSSITIHSDSLVKFEGASLRIEHGGATASTSKGIEMVAGDVKVSPSSSLDWTEFSVTDVDGTVRIAARKGDLTINDGEHTTTLAQGQETTRDENSGTDSNGKKRKRKAAAGATPAAGGGIMNSPYAVAAGGAAVGGVLLWVLLKNDEPASPTKP